MKVTVEPLEKSRRLERLGDLEIWRLGRDRLDEFNDYVYRIYHQTRAARYNWQPQNEFAEMKEDSQRYFDRAVVCAITDLKQQLLGTWGLIYKNLNKDKFELPIEKRFGLSSDEIKKRAKAPEVEYFFNGWRTAIDKDALENLGYDKSKSIYIFDLLLRGLCHDVSSENQRFLGVAEMENLVLRYHKRIGVPWVKLGDAKTYWGNTKFPCAFKVGEFIDSLRENHSERYHLIFDPASVKGLSAAEMHAGQLA